MCIVEKIYRHISRLILRKKLRNCNFTLFTNTCIGGVIYHELGLKFMSPTINLWMHDKDFYKFVNNLHHYISQKLHFVDDIADYPVAYLDDVLIHFNHYKTKEEASLKWYTRCERINWDNIYVICSDRPLKGNVVTHEEMKSLESLPIKGKAIFSVRKYDDIDYIIPLHKDPNGDYVNTYMFDRSKILRRWYWEDVFDYVMWLNKGN